MAEEKKNILGTAFKVILGIAFIVLGVMAVVVWWSSLVDVFKGCVGLFLILAGLITLAIAKE